jgi:hypothetical protein
MDPPESVKFICSVMEKGAESNEKIVEVLAL